MRISSGVFIDTGAFLAMLIPDDQYSSPADEAWKVLEKERTPLFSSEPVLIETSNFLIRQQGPEITSEWLKASLNSNEIRWLQPSKDDLRNAIDFIIKYSDQGISMTDAVSFSLMRRHCIQHAFSFDRHFSMAGFKLLQ
ncbi:MAG: PIN domain-containing protein [Victivallales bacterium]